MNYEICTGINFYSAISVIWNSQFFEQINSCFKFFWIASVRFLPPIFGTKLCFPLRLKTIIGIPL